MNSYLAILAALAVVPFFLVLFLRVNGAIAFMSLCLGSVLVTYTSGDVTSVFGSFSASHNDLTTNQWVQSALLVAPFLFTLLFAQRSIKGGGKVLNLIPAAATGFLFALLLVPLLPSGVQHQVDAVKAWKQLNDAQTGIILGGAFFSLIFLLLTRHPKLEESKKKK